MTFQHEEYGSLSEMMWVEKYRPKTLTEVINQQAVVSRLLEMLTAKDLPHLLFIGPPGTGKTAVILSFAQDFYGTNYQANCLELNASDERGINVIRVNVKNFARTRSLTEVPFKLIILDEADHLTSEAQHALRRTMENYARTCRFCLIGNYGSRIIPPIQSRCALFRFTPLNSEDIMKRLRYIAEKEQVQLTDGGVKAIIEASEGDLRRAINMFQASAVLGEEVTYQSVYDVMGLIRPIDLQKMITFALKAEFIPARDELRKLLIEKGYSEADLLQQMHRFILDSGLKEKWKVGLIEAIGDADYKITSGADPEIQLSALLAKMVLIGSELQNDY
jgi:replication factor C small subunit